jgi:hypothetical protein
MRKILKYKSLLKVASAVLLISVVSACSVKYSMSGASIAPDVKTISVQMFINRAPIVKPQLSQQLTEAFKTKCRAQTSLTMINGIGDVNFDGEITDYSIKPKAIEGNDIAAMNRLSITVKIKYTNSIDPKQSFEQSFTRYKDYDSKKSPSQVEGTLVPEIIELLTEDIFNKAFVNW